MGQYRYKAFISYRHVERDRQWARWLIQNLETFRTPKALVEKGAPSRIGHLFRDDDEIPASSDLSNQIEEALRDSEFFIVVCSPRTPHSKWVRREVEIFQKLGRDNRILVLLTEGEPEEFFPPELLRIQRERVAADGTKTVEWEEVEPLAADVREHPEESERATKQRALLRIAAGLLGVTYDALVRREQRRASQQRRLSAAAGAVLLMALAGGGYAYWDNNTLHTRYYRDYGTHWGVPIGIGEISAEMASHRNVSYAIDTLRGHVVAMRRENGLHGLMPSDGDDIHGEAWEAWVAEWRFPSPGERASQINLFGWADTPLRTDKYAWESDGSAVLSFANASGGASSLQGSDTGTIKATDLDYKSTRSQIALQRLRFDGQGRVVERLNRTVWGAPARDANGRFGTSYAYDSTGRIANLRSIAASGQLLSGKEWTRLVRKFSAAGDLRRVEWRNSDGGLVPNADGCAVVRIEWDNYGNEVEHKCLDSSGKPVLSRDEKVATTRMRYDGVGNEIERAFFGTDANPKTSETSGTARYGEKYDMHGNEVEDISYGTDGRPVARKNLGWAQVKFTLEPNGLMRTASYFDVRGKPFVCKCSGAARHEYRWDPRGNLVEDKKFGTDGKPTIANDAHAARIMNHYNDQDNLIETEYYGLNNKPVSRIAGPARESHRYDERGDQLELAFFGADGKPILSNKEGVAKIVYRYDDRGNEVDEAYYGMDAQPILRKVVNVARITARYDDHGNRIEEDYFGADGKSVMNEIKGAAKMVYRYNDEGDLVWTKRYDTQGHLMPGHPESG